MLQVGEPHKINDGKDFLVTYRLEDSELVSERIFTKFYPTVSTVFVPAADDSIETENFISGLRVSFEHLTPEQVSRLTTGDETSRMVNVIIPATKMGEQNFITLAQQYEYIFGSFGGRVERIDRSLDFFAEQYLTNTGKSVLTIDEAKAIVLLFTNLNDLTGVYLSLLGENPLDGDVYRFLKECGALLNEAYVTGQVLPLEVLINITHLKVDLKQYTKWEKKALELTKKEKFLEALMRQGFNDKEKIDSAFNDFPEEWLKEMLTL